MLTKHFKNISNYFSEVDDVGKAFEWIMDGDSEAVFGVEVEHEGGIMNTTLFTPPYTRLGVEVSRLRLVDCEDELTCYEGCLLEPYFLPLYGAFNGGLLNALDSLSLADEEAVALQFLFRRRTDDWKSRAVEMYSSFLDGNDYPLHSKIGRMVQGKVLGLLNRISSIDTTKAYIEEAEQKILDEGYQFQLRVLIKSTNPEYVKGKLEEVFKQYDSYNAIRLIKQRNKRFKQLYRELVLTYDSFTQILSRKEIASMFGGRVPSVDVAPVVAKPISEVISAKTVAVVRDVDTSGLVGLLPYYQREDVYADNEVVTDIAEAMKRVGLIRQARLYNESVTAGVRLTVVQCDIPKDKNLSHLKNKTEDIQAAMGVLSLGIEQGEEANTVKFTIPNEAPAIISLRELMEAPEFKEYAKEKPLAFIVGVDEINNPIYLSLTKLVHLLVAGTTGSGKSVFLNALIVCLLANHGPDELRMYMIDPKEVELQQYRGFPHVEDVITDMEEADGTLEDIVDEMDKRYSIFREAGAKNIEIYNQKSDVKMPYIVCVIDEYADLKDTHPKVEDHIARLGQKARAAGIHMIIATQRPEAKIISGRVKAVIPSAISFYLKSNIDYKTVFGTGIPYSQLLGRGDGVMKIEGYPKLFQRFQSAIISPDELEEEEIFNKMRDYLSSATVEPIQLAEPVSIEVAEEVEIRDPEDLKEQLKKIILEKGETRIDSLRKELQVKNATVVDLMNELVEEGFLIKHKSKAKGYELAKGGEEIEETV